MTSNSAVACLPLAILDLACCTGGFPDRIVARAPRVPPHERPVIVPPETDARPITQMLVICGPLTGRGAGRGRRAASLPVIPASLRRRPGTVASERQRTIRRPRGQA